MPFCTVVVPEEKKIEDMNADELLEHYLRTTSYFDQTFKSISAAASSVWKKQVCAVELLPMQQCIQCWGPMVHGVQTNHGRPCDDYVMCRLKGWVAHDR